MTQARRPPRERRARARGAAEPRDGVLSRAELRALGVDRNMVAREVSAERWVAHGRQTVAVHTGGLSSEARRWRAVWEVGLKIAALDGISALQHAGLTGFEEERVHVSVRHTAEIRVVEGVTVHKVIRRIPDEVIRAGVPRTRPAAAAVRAAHWAVSDRQAALLLVMPVQQRLCTGAQLMDAVKAIPGRSRRRFIATIANDVAGGSHSLQELDFVRACHRRGLPQPDRQAVRRLAGGTAYLDVQWRAARLAVELDGSGHRMGLQMADDDLRANEVRLGDDLVLRIGVLGWRLTPELYLDQVCAAYWRRLRRAS